MDGKYSLAQGTDAFCEFVETALKAMRTMPRDEFMEVYSEAKVNIPESLQDEVLIQSSLPAYMIQDLMKDHEESFKASWEQHDSEVYFEFFKTLMTMTAISQEPFFEAIYETKAYEKIEKIAFAEQHRETTRSNDEPCR